MSTLDYHQVAEGVYCIDTHLGRPVQTAAYLIVDDGELAFVDTGAANNVPALLKVAEDLGFDPAAVRYVLPTHVHLDHAGGSGALMAACPNATLVTHPKGVPHLIDPSRLQQGATAVYGESEFMRLFGALQPIDASRVDSADERRRLTLGNRQIAFLDTPGHANHHGCYFDLDSRLLFTGDTFGLSYREFDNADGPWMIATTTPVAFDPAAWQRSLDRMMALEPEAVCVTHFGRLDHPQRLVDMLRASIDGHRDIALREAGTPLEGRAARLQSAIDAWLVEEAVRRRPEMSRDRARELLSLDIELNAQGIEVWLQRREKAAAKASA